MGGRGCLARLTNCHSRISGNGLNTPLDSSLRWNDEGVDSGLRRAATGLLPSRRIQDFLSINDGGAEVRNSAGMVKGYRDGDKPAPAPVVIPAKAGIQGGEAEVLDWPLVVWVVGAA